MIEKGWVRYIGASSMAAWEFQNLQNLAATHGWHRFISMQNYHNPVSYTHLTLPTIYSV